jgi:sirohydrochlorin cobaltochelatase
MNKTGIILCGHGTRSSEGLMEFLELAKKFAAHHPDYFVECGFLEFHKPDFEESLQALILKEVDTVIVLPVFLFTGVHLQYDIPLAFNNLAGIYKDVKILMARQIGVCDPLVELIDKLVHSRGEFRKDYPESNDNSNNCLMLAGIGASMKEANADLAKLTRLAWERSGFGYATYSFVSKLTRPTVEEGLSMLDLLPFNKIIVVPVLFFSGYYMQNIYLAVESFKKTTKKNIILTKPFGDDDFVLQALSNRLHEVLNEKVNVLEKLPVGLRPRRKFY